MMVASLLRFRTVAVATDLSVESMRAFDYALAIARKHNATLVIIHIIDPAGYAFPLGAPAALMADQSARSELERMEKTVSAQGIEVRSVVQSGLIYQRIIEAVNDHHLDLLVLGTRVKDQTGRLALGTVARELLARIPCSILTVPNDAPLLPETLWRRVLVAIDFSAASLSALQRAQSIVTQELIVLLVAPVPENSSAAELLERLRYVAPLNESHTVPVNHIIATGEAGAVISEQMKHLTPDLVVLGAPKRMLSADELADSTILEVIANARCPVLCVTRGALSEDRTFSRIAIEQGL